MIAVSYRLRRTLDFSLGVLAAYLGLLRILGDMARGSSGLIVVAVSSLAVIALLVRVQRRMREPA